VSIKRSEGDAMSKIFEQLFDDNVRIEGIYLAVDDEFLNSAALTDELEYFGDALGFAEDEDIEVMLQKLHGKLVAKVSTPIMNGSSYSWGYCTITLVCADTIEEIVKKACKWAKKAGKK
jgi:hypothetical protein